MENIVNAMYEGQNQVDIETTITYRGRQKVVMRLRSISRPIQGEDKWQKLQDITKKREQRYSYG